MNRSRGLMAGIAALVVVVLLGVVLVMNRNNTQPIDVDEGPAIAQENEAAENEVAVAVDQAAPAVASAEEEVDPVAVVTAESAEPAEAEDLAESDEAVAVEEPVVADEPATVEESATSIATAETQEAPAATVESTTAEATSTGSNSPFSELTIASTLDPSITDGETLFIDNCAKCHGLEGYGNGPSMGSLGTITGNFVLLAMEDYTDEELFAIISHGKGIEMPPWGLVMTEEQRWALVDYVRTLRVDGS